MPLQTDQLTPIEIAQNRALSFGMNMCKSVAVTTIMKSIEDMRLQGKELLIGFKESEGQMKKDFQTAISNNIQDRKMLLETIFMNPLEKDV